MIAALDSSERTDATVRFFEVNTGPVVQDSRKALAQLLATTVAKYKTNLNQFPSRHLQNLVYDRGSLLVYGLPGAIDLTYELRGIEFNVSHEEIEVRLACVDELTRIRTLNRLNALLAVLIVRKEGQSVERVSKHGPDVGLSRI